MSSNSNRIPTEAYQLKNKWKRIATELKYAQFHCQFHRTNFRQNRNKSRTTREMVNIHGDPVGIKGTSGGIILETTEEVVVSNSVELGISLEGVHRALALYGVGALNVVVIGEKDLLGSVELSPAADRFLRPIVPAHVHLHVRSPTVRLDPLDLRHVRRLPRLHRPHQHAVAGWEKTETEFTFHWIRIQEKSSSFTSDGFVDGFDGVGVKGLPRSFRFGHGNSADLPTHRPKTQTKHQPRKSIKIKKVNFPNKNEMTRLDSKWSTRDNSEIWFSTLRDWMGTLSLE